MQYDNEYGNVTASIIRYRISLGSYIDIDSTTLGDKRDLSAHPGIYQQNYFIGLCSLLYFFVRGSSKKQS